jgi:MFS family permease
VHGRILAIVSLLSSVVVLLMGHGLQLSLLPLRAEAAGWPEFEIGLSGSFYFAGFLLGCFTVPRLVWRVGHIRVFMVLTATLTTGLLGIALFNDALAWFALRALTGWSISGLYLVMESWLNEEASNQHRGAVLSIYTVTVLAAMALGQLLLNLAAPDGLSIVVVAAALVALAAVPVGLTRIPQPGAIPPATFSPWLVLRTSRAAVVSSFASGIVTGGFWGVGSLYGRQIGLDVGGISLIMAMGVVGGAFFQLPLGRASDRVDRRFVVAATLAGGALACVVGFTGRAEILPYVFFVLGGCVMPIYALSLAHAADQTESSFLEVGTGILVVNAGGAIAGPLLTAGVMETWGAPSFFAINGLILALAAAGVLLMALRRPALRPHFNTFEPTSPELAQGAIEMDPRSDPGASPASDVR